MAKNKISDLRDHLFAALERIDDDTLTPEQIEAEVNKAKAISAIGSVIINSAKIEVDFIKATGRLDSASELLKSIDNDQKRIA